MPIRTHAARALLLMLGMLSGGVLTACGVSGPPMGGPLPQVTDLHGVTLTGSAVLAAPAEWTPAPTIATPVYAVGAPALLAAMTEIMLAEPRTWLTVSYPQGEAFFIIRSLLLNLPDIVVVQAIAVTDHASRAVILSESRYDVLHVNFPVIGRNEARVRHLVDALTSRFGVVPTPAP